MLDLLAAISSVDPPALLAWLILAFAASGYPLGIMLGSSCSPCCNPCPLCTEGALPDTVTVTFSGWQDTLAQSEDLIYAPVTSDFGFSATVRVTAPGETPGPISAATVTNGGEGYARIVRVEPTVTATASGGSGASFGVTLDQIEHEGRPAWEVASVSLTSGGTGYPDSGSLTFNVATGDAVVSAASAQFYSGRVAPTVTAAASGGSGASLSVTLTQSTDWQGLDVWGVSAVSVTSGGTGYTDGSEVTFTVTDGVAVYGASAMITVGREEPTVTASVPAPSAGTGAVLAVTLTASGTNWTVSNLSITNGGSGYSAGDSIALATGDTEESGGYAIVDTVNGSGAITAVTIYSGGSYYRSTGVIESVYIGSGGEYFKSTGIIASVELDYYGGGIYYRDDPSLPGEKANVSITVNQQGPNSVTASGASLTAVIDDDAESATFGQIVGVTIASGGTGYLAWKLYQVECCEDYYNDLTLVLQRNTGQFLSSHPGACQYKHTICGTLSKADSGESGTTAVYVVYNGPATPSEVIVYGNDDVSCRATLSSTTNISNCDTFSFTATDENGRSASVTAGGDYDAGYKNGSWVNCFRCCRGEENAPLEVEVDVWPTGFFTGVDGEKTRLVLVRSGGGSQSTAVPIHQFLPSSGRWVTPSSAVVAGAPRLSLWIEPCRNKDNASGALPWCADCWDKCQTRATIDRTDAGGPTLFFYSKPCESCSTGPICSPGSGVILLEEIVNPSGFASDGNLRWNVEVI